MKDLRMTKIVLKGDFATVNIPVRVENVEKHVALTKGKRFLRLLWNDFHIPYLYIVIKTLS